MQRPQILYCTRKGGFFKVMKVIKDKSTGVTKLNYNFH